jgi:hypothetical protein
MSQDNKSPDNKVQPQQGGASGQPNQQGQQSNQKPGQQGQQPNQKPGQQSQQNQNPDQKSAQQTPGQNANKN